MPVTRSKEKNLTPSDEAQEYCRRKCDPGHVQKQFIDQWIGYGLFANRSITKGQFIAEYRGHCTDEGSLQSDSCFQYYFTYKGKRLCIDASNSDCFAKYANDTASINANAAMKIMQVDDRPHLCLFATNNINSGEEVRYDYGVKNSPWRIQQSKNWPHRLIEATGVTACHSCSNPMSSVQWDGLSCIDCGNIWHQGCFKKIPVEKRHCWKRQSTMEKSDESAMSMLLAMSDPNVLSAEDDHLNSPGISKPLEERVLESEDETTACHKSRDIEIDSYSDSGSHSADDGSFTPSMFAQSDDRDDPGEGNPLCTSFPRTDCEPSASKESGQCPYRRSSQDDNEVSMVTDPCNLSVTVPASSHLSLAKVGDENTCESPKHLNSVEERIRTSSGDIETDSVIDSDSSDETYQPSKFHESDESHEESDDESHEDIDGNSVCDSYSSADIQPSSSEEPALCIQKRSTQNNNSALPDKSVLCDVTSSSSVGEVNADKKYVPYKKPYRLCPFCNTLKSKLSQHIETQHKDEKCVADALALPKKEKTAAMASFKKQGILKVNKDQAKEENPSYQRERFAKKDNGLVMCSHCSGFYAKSYMKRHTVSCQGEASVPSVAVPVQLFSCDEDASSEFLTEVLTKFRRDKIGIFCTSDPVLLSIGRRLWYKQRRKVDKRIEVRRSVMADMRRLGSLYQEFKNQQECEGGMPEDGNLSDLFKRSNFSHLEFAIESYTTKETNGTMSVKAGLKNALYYLLKSAAKILKASYLIDDNDKDAEEIDKFTAVLELNYNYLFGDAVYKTLQQRQVKLRRPETLPDEDDIRKLRVYTLQKMAQLSESDTADVHRFVELRDLVVCRLTLFNARRGGEPSRLLLQEWRDAENQSWLDSNHLESLEGLDKTLAASLQITYQSGKGSKHLVPVLFPADTLEPIRKLCSETWRQEASINKANPYLFPSINGSPNHVSGWHAVQQCCNNLELKSRSLITATKNRHRVSTLFALMDVPESDREFIYKHLGHSKETNCNIYQTPLAVKELTVVGRRLQTIDEDPPEEEQHEREILEEESGSKQSTAKKDEVVYAVSESTISTSTLDVSKVRTYKTWTKDEAEAVAVYFKDYYKGVAEKKLPGKREIMEFLKENPTFSKEWKTIHTKVMNDVRLKNKRTNNRENEWSSDST